MARVYLDHASSTPLRAGALDAMLPYLREHIGDPGRVHAEGKTTRVAIETAREQVAALLGARPREVVFTATGTESVNAAIWGAVARAAGTGPHVVTTAIEHSSVIDACDRAAADVTRVEPDRLGRVAADAFAAALRPSTALVSMQLANHEVGTVQQSLAEVVELVRDRTHDRAGGAALVHVDACAAAGHVPVDFAALGADLLSVTAHKLGGPKGAAALLVRRGLRIPPFVVGGMQERARRGGIEDVPAIVGFGAAAAELLDGDRLATEATVASAHTARLLDAMLAVEGVERYGDPDSSLPHLVCVGVEGVEAEPILLSLDQRGIAVHSGSSCSSEALEPSPVLAAMGVDADRSLRPSVGWSTTDADVETFCAAFPEVVGKLRALRAR